MRDHYILISESKVGIHAKESTVQETYISIPLTFPINASRQSCGKYSLTPSEFQEIPEEKKGALRKKYEYIKKVFDSAEKSKEYTSSIVLIAHDNDTMGDLMALSVRDALMAAGVPRDKLMRLPLTEWGYLGFSPFLDENNIQGYLKLKAEEKPVIALQRGKLSRTAGITKQVSLKYIYNLRDKKIEGIFDLDHISQDGTSTATVAVKFMEE